MDRPLPLVQIRNVSKNYAYGKKTLCALQDITLEIDQGTTLGIVGESGCGKSTLGRICIRLEDPSQGEILFQNRSLNALSNQQMRPLRRQMQMIFQDPYSSLNPRFTIEQIIGEGIEVHKLAEGDAKREIIEKLMLDVGLEVPMLQRYPHEFSGGQKQRIGIARALAVYPKFIVCDEPLSALDACTQKQIIELLLRIKRERQLAYLFISHDLHAVEAIADNVAVMYLGRVVEQAPAKKLFASPLHPYTKALMDAVPMADPVKERSRKRLTLYGEAPSPLDPPKGCPFHPRCPKATSLCKESAPQLREVACGHRVACHFPLPLPEICMPK
jgi:oligopeptide transport system ATP-binding protein